MSMKASKAWDISQGGLRPLGRLQFGPPPSQSAQQQPAPAPAPAAHNPPTPGLRLVNPTQAPEATSQEAQEK
jgi:hypothetical protein